MRVSFLMANLSTIINNINAREEYMQNTVFNNASSFEKAIQKHEMNPDHMSWQELEGL